MYKRGVFEILSNDKIAKDVYKMKLLGDADNFSAPGQFINIELAGKYLRRPISVYDWDAGSITIIYKILGAGTLQMSTMQKGECLDILTGLGNGFDVSKCQPKTLLVGGGVGVPPMYGLAKALIARGFVPEVLLGFCSSEDVFCEQDFLELGCKVYISTNDGSCGQKGFVTDAIREMPIDFDYYCACGPEPMLQALYNHCPQDGQLSFEERMGCGFGACMGCSCQTKYGYKRICKEGPVLQREEIIW